LLENGNADFPLPPILVGLSIVMHAGESLYNISETHPRRHIHEFYFPDAEFPDLSTFLPPRAERWWERLGCSYY
jgi:hypothetical protein